jgi:RecB family exonuclease
MFLRMSGWVCFEDSTAEFWARHRHADFFTPGPNGNLIQSTTLDQWLDALGIEPITNLTDTEVDSMPSPVEAFVRSVLPTTLHGEMPHWIEAVGVLRQSGVDSVEHADYLFSQLPQTPKNQLLHFLIRRYVESSPWDKQSRLREASEQARTLLIAAPAAQLLFVQSANPTPAFVDLAHAFANLPGVESVSCIGPFEKMALGSPYIAALPVPSAQVKPRPLTLVGGLLARLDKLAERACMLMRRGIGSEIFLSCSQAHREYLKLRLAVLGVDVFDGIECSALVPGKKNPDTSLTRSVVLSRVRQCTQWKWQKRASLEARVLRLELQAAPAQDWIQAYAQTWEDKLLDIALGATTETRPGARGKKNPDSFYQYPGQQVLLFPWSGKIQSDRRTFFFEHVVGTVPPNPVWSTDDKKAAERLGFGPIPTFRSEQTCGRPTYLLPESATHKFAGMFAEGFRAHTIRPVSNSVPAADPLPHFTLSPISKPSLSATSAKHYLECPSKYFFQHVLNLYPQKDPRSDIQLYFGILVHKALEIFFRPRMDPALAEVSLDQAFDAAYRHSIREKSAWLRREVLETLWNRIAMNIAKLEAELDSVFGKRRIFGIEYEFRMDWEGCVLKGRIDRIDLLENASLLLIDYKTGTVDFTPNHMAQGKDFQPWLYLHAVKNLAHAASGLLYYELKGASVSRGILNQQFVDKKYAKSFVRGHLMAETAMARLQEDAEASLRKVATGIRAGDFGAKPSAAVCQYCDYSVHCRQSACLEGALI